MLLRQVTLFPGSSTTNRLRVVENYESLIWVEKFNSPGTMEMKVKVRTDKDKTDLLKLGDCVLLDNMPQGKMVDQVKGKMIEGGAFEYTISATSIDYILNNRMVYEGVYGSPTQSITLMRERFNSVYYGEEDKITNLFFQSTVTSPLVTVSVPENGMPLYQFIQEACDGSGLRFYIKSDPSSAAPDTYRNLVVVEAPTNHSYWYAGQLGNIQDSMIGENIRDSYNAVQVWSKGKTASYTATYPAGAVNMPRGINRRTYTEVDNAIDGSKMTSGQLQNAVSVKAATVLNKKRARLIVEGTLIETPDFMYGKDFLVGDTVNGIADLASSRFNGIRLRIVSYTRAFDKQNGQTSFSNFEVVQ